MGFLKDFKEFAVKGNMVDIAIGVILGAAFNKVVDVLVKQIFMPPLAYLTDGVSWENRKIVLRDAITGAEGNVIREEISIGYGQLIEASVDFIIIGFTVFVIVKMMNRLKKKAEEPKDQSVATPKDIELLNKLAELLEEQNQLLVNNKK